MTLASLGISILAFLVSAATLWLSHLHRGKLRMTRPTQVYFGPDGGEKGISKIYLCSLIYSTSKRGIVLENLYARLKRGETQQNFNIWVYGVKDLKRGSGLFIAQEGIATNHHFLAPSEVGSFDFSAGDYKLEVFGKVVGIEGVSLLSSIDLKIDSREADKLRQADHGIYFDWGPDAGRYQTKIEGKRTRGMDPMTLLESLRDGAPSEKPDPTI